MTNKTNEAIERYKLEIVNNHGDRYIRCEPAPDGSWIMFKDVAMLQARIAELESALRGIIDYVEDTGRDYCEWYHDTKEMARAALEGGKKDG